ncbi:MAG: hypothetical protein ABIH28_00020 [archaeon]
MKTRNKLGLAGLCLAGGLGCAEMYEAKSQVTPTWMETRAERNYWEEKDETNKLLKETYEKYPWLREAVRENKK